MRPEHEKAYLTIRSSILELGAQGAGERKQIYAVVASARLAVSALTEHPDSAHSAAIVLRKRVALALLALDSQPVKEGESDGLDA